MNARILLAVPLALLLAGVAAANILLVTEQHLAPGTSFDIQGNGFGRKPTAWLDLDGRRIPLRLAKGGTDAALRATLASLPYRAHGDCLLKVRPKNSKIAFALAGMTIELPAVDDIAQDTAAVRTEITIHGQYFGARRGKVEIGGKRAKVVSWTADTVQAVVPAGIPSGLTYVYVTNRAGTSTDLVSFNVQ
jgi:hypothetical protein